MAGFFGASVRSSRVLLAGLAFAIIAYFIHMAGAIAMMQYYQDPAYFAVWSKVMMPAAGPPPASFTAYSLLFNLIAGVLFAFVYAVVRSSLPAGTPVGKGVRFGALVFLLAGIPAFFSLYLLINLPAALLFEWTLESLVVYLASGVVAAKIID